MSWLDAWAAVFSLDAQNLTSPERIGLACVALLVVMVFVLMPVFLFVPFLDRKVTADFQARVGPNRAGPRGLFQPLADLLKLLQKSASPTLKEAEIPLETRQRKLVLWMLFQWFVLFSTLATVPIASALLLLDSPIGTLLIPWAILGLSFGDLLFASAQMSDVSRWLRAFRASGQALAALFPALIAMLCVAIETKSLQWSVILSSQAGGVLHWHIARTPMLFVSFFVFFISGLVLAGVTPFDGGRPQECFSGDYSHELHGFLRVLHGFSNLYAFLLWCLMTSHLFLGGWQLPEVFAEASGWRRIALEITMSMAKALLLGFAALWVARVTPRGRIDQVTDFSWRVLSPLSILMLLGGLALEAHRNGHF